ELLVKPGRPAAKDSNTQEVGSCTVGIGAVPVLMSAAAGATIEWPAASHACLSFLRHRENKNRQQIQSHQKNRSMLSSSKSQEYSISEKPYRVGQLFARPPSSAAQAFSSCSKN